MAQPGIRNLITDVAGLRVGQAEDRDVRTGTTVIVADQPVVAAVAIAGGGPGTRETELLRGGMMVDDVDAICLSGGSAFGLAAAEGWPAALKQAGRGFALNPMPGVPPTPIVPAAIPIAPPAICRTRSTSAPRCIHPGESAAGSRRPANAASGDNVLARKTNVHESALVKPRWLTTAARSAPRSSHAQGHRESSRGHN